MAPKNPPLPAFPTASASLRREHMEEDEKEIEIDVGGDRVEVTRRESRRETTEQNATHFYFGCFSIIIIFVKSSNWEKKDKISLMQRREE